MKISWLLLICLIFASCQQRFDKSLWDFYDGMFYPERNRMIDDVVKNHHLKGKSYKAVINLLGEADGIDSAGIYYKVKVDYGSDIDPVYTKDLFIRFDKDSVASDVYVKEWHNE